MKPALTTRALPLCVPTRPALRWHGGKWRLAPWIISHFPQHRVYVEPFGGAASVLLRKPRSYAEVYNDLDSHVVNLFTVMRDRGDELLERLRLTPFARDEFLAAYEASDDQLEAARRLVVLSFMGFSSNAHSGLKTGFRSNSNRSGTSPARDWMNYPDAARALVERLRGVVIENRDAVDVMRQHDAPTTLHYLDPPYVPTTRDKGRDYRHELTHDDHAALLASARSLQGMVVISGYRCELYDDTLADWSRIDKAAYADGARKRTESLWLSPGCTAQRGQDALL